jgi:phosphoribosyl 1,2-cyclic phosphodiesterase
MIDCGISIRELQRSLATWELTPADLSGVLITHEHNDHVRSLEQILRRGTPVFATHGTADALGLPHDRYTKIAWSRTVTIGSLGVTPIQTSHDAAEPCGLMIETGGVTIALLTDLGVTTSATAESAAEADLLIIESNHCHHMLRSGPYPAHLKRRVASNLGHLSNDQCAELVCTVSTKEKGPSHIWLAHLSATNNTARLASEVTVRQLAACGVQASVSVLPRGKPGPLWTGDSARARQLRMAMDL